MKRWLLYISIVFVLAYLCQWQTISSGKIDRNTYYKILNILNITNITIHYEDKINFKTLNFKALDTIIECDDTNYEYCSYIKQSNKHKWPIKSYDISDPSTLKPFVLHIPDIVTVTGLSGAKIFMLYHNVPRPSEGHCNKENNYLFTTNLLTDRWWYTDECPECDTQFSTIHEYDGLTIKVLMCIFKICGESDAIIQFNSQLISQSLVLPIIPELIQYNSLCLFNYCIIWNTTRSYTDDEIYNIGLEAAMYVKYQYKNDQLKAYNIRHGIFADFYK